jgi:hypothetical protein
MRRDDHAARDRPLAHAGAAVSTEGRSDDGDEQTGNDARGALAGASGSQQRCGVGALPEGRGAT